MLTTETKERAQAALRTYADDLLNGGDGYHTAEAADDRLTEALAELGFDEGRVLRTALDSLHVLAMGEEDGTVAEAAARGLILLLAVA